MFIKKQLILKKNELFDTFLFAYLRIYTILLKPLILCLCIIVTSSHDFVVCIYHLKNIRV